MRFFFSMLASCDGVVAIGIELLKEMTSVIHSFRVRKPSLDQTIIHDHEFFGSFGSSCL